MVIPKTFTAPLPLLPESATYEVALLSEKGIQHLEGRGRIRGLAAGSGSPNLVFAKLALTGTLESGLSRRLIPQVKWSYLRAFRRWLIGFLALAWLILYLETVRADGRVIHSRPLVAFCGLGIFVLGYLWFVVGSHNLFVYPK